MKTERSTKRDNAICTGNIRVLSHRGSSWCNLLSIPPQAGAICIERRDRTGQRSVPWFETGAKRKRLADRLEQNADVMVKAIGGHLSITDGQYRKELDLDPGELRSGSIVYTPVTDSVVVRLQVVGGNSAPPVSESVRVLAGIAPALSSETRTHESSPGKSTESRLKASSTVPSVAGGLGGSEKQAPTVPRETLATPAKTDPRKFEKIAGNVRPARPIASATSRATEFEAANRCDPSSTSIGSKRIRICLGATTSCTARKSVSWTRGARSIRLNSLNERLRSTRRWHSNSTFRGRSN